MDITKLSNTYDIKYLTEQDIPKIMELCKANPQYYKHCPPDVSEESIRKDMHALPQQDALHRFYIFFLSAFDGMGRSYQFLRLK